MLLQRMAALEEMLKLQKTQVYVLSLKYCPGVPLTNSAISDSVPFFGIIFGP